DAVGDTADDATEVRVALEVAVEVVEAEDDVGELAVAVGDVQLGDDAAVVGDLDRHAFGVGEYVQLDRRTLGGLAEMCHLHPRLPPLLLRCQCRNSGEQRNAEYKDA